jgi:SAM-dependent methyltransferase
MHTTAVERTARSAYEGVESLDQFSSKAELEEYRRGLLAKTALEVEFIKREVGRKNLRVVELGTGGGRLLIALALAGIARWARGVDVARSRVEFARRWADDLGLGNVEFVAGDALEPDSWAVGEVDLFICITNIFGYLGAVRADAPAEVLRRAYRSLAPDGCLLLEGYQLTARHRQILAASDNHFRTWMPLPKWDRFAYYLSDIAFDPSTRVLRHEKTFIGRDGSIDVGRIEENSFYSRDEVLDWVRPEGCDRYRAFRNYASEPYSEESTQMVLLLGARHWQPPPDTGRRAIVLAPPRAVSGTGLGAWS